MELFDKNWNFDRSKYVVCNRFHKDPLMLMTRKEWAQLNKELRANGETEWIETIR